MQMGLSLPILLPAFWCDGGLKYPSGPTIAHRPASPTIFTTHAMHPPVCMVRRYLHRGMRREEEEEEEEEEGLFKGAGGGGGKFGGGVAFVMILSRVQPSPLPSPPTSTLAAPPPHPRHTPSHIHAPSHAHLALALRIAAPTATCVCRGVSNTTEYAVLSHTNEHVFPVMDFVS